MAELFAAMVFDYINFKLFMMQTSPTGVMPSGKEEPSIMYDPNKKIFPPLIFKYDIIDAAKPDRVGGRLFAYNFGGPRDTHDYYDVGEMRFPDNPVMTR